MSDSSPNSREAHAPFEDLIFAYFVIFIVGFKVIFEHGMCHNNYPNFLDCNLSFKVILETMNLFFLYVLLHYL